MNKFSLAAFVVTAAAAIALPALAQSPIDCGGRCDVPNGGGNGSSYGSGFDCGDGLGHLKRVYPAQVLGIESEQRVWVTEFCLGSELMRSDGNAAYLRTAIADNDVLVDVLGSQGYFAEDVFAVKMMGDDTINLFVHRFSDSGRSMLLK